MTLDGNGHGRPGNGSGTGAGLRHRLLTARSGDERDELLATGAVEGLDDGQAVLAALDPAAGERLRRHLGARAADVVFLGHRDLYTFPAWALARLRHEIEERTAGGTRLRLLAEPRWWDRPADEWEAWVSVDAVVNAAFGSAPLDLLCAYDESTAPPEVVEAAWRTHPEVVVDGRTGHNERYTDPALYCTRHRERPLPALPAPVEEHPFAGATLSSLRRVVAAWATGAGLPDRRVPELVLAVSEVATNSLRHGGGQGTLRLAATADELLVEVQDAGVITVPFAGLLPPPRGGDGGHGLWLVHQLVELVQIRSGPAGSVVRLHVRRGTAS
ncbi:MAG TPA: sensor histidine kinase [Acidimicrobiales bacterium]|jgi:anti-sigma regulatory factor (Ser/Thr protein kinase)|nr:sensor histidine kinase [Acidimicrobiales bacterium]